MPSSADSKSHPGRIPDAFEERLDRADRARGEEYLDELAADRRQEKAPKCAWTACHYPAVLGPYCAYHSTADLRSKQSGKQVSV